jgi:hypothetical protein
MPTEKFFNLPDKSADGSLAHGGITFISRAVRSRDSDRHSVG